MSKQNVMQSVAVSINFLLNEQIFQLLVEKRVQRIQRCGDVKVVVVVGKQERWISMRWGCHIIFILCFFWTTLDVGFGMFWKFDLLPEKVAKSFEMFWKSEKATWHCTLFPRSGSFDDWQSLTGPSYGLMLTLLLSSPQRWRTRFFWTRPLSPIFKPDMLAHMFHVPKLVVLDKAHNIHYISQWEIKWQNTSSVRGEKMNFCAHSCFTLWWEQLLAANDLLMICVTNMFTSWQLLPLNQYLIDWLQHWVH